MNFQFMNVVMRFHLTRILIETLFYSQNIEMSLKCGLALTDDFEINMFRYDQS